MEALIFQCLKEALDGVWALVIEELEAHLFRRVLTNLEAYLTVGAPGRRNSLLQCLVPFPLVEGEIRLVLVLEALGGPLEEVLLRLEEENLIIIRLGEDDRSQSFPRSRESSVGVHETEAEPIGTECSRRQ